jgi:hypothetical protein
MKTGKGMLQEKEGRKGREREVKVEERIKNKEKKTRSKKE